MSETPQIIIKGRAATLKKMSSFPGPCLSCNITVTNWAVTFKTAWRWLTQGALMEFTVNYDGEFLHSGKVILIEINSAGEYIFATTGKVKTVKLRAFSHLTNQSCNVTS